jgi:hypothetical protein
MERVNNNLLTAMELRNNDDIMMYVDNRWLLITTVIAVDCLNKKYMC